MRYQLVTWFHELDSQPVWLFSEVDEHNREVRKVERYRNGRLDLAGDGIETGSTFLAEKPMPTLDEIDVQEQFSAKEIHADDFEKAWREALDWFDLL